jgi:hypothetical protein
VTRDPPCRYDDGDDAANFLNTLQESLKWEVRSLYIVLLGVTVRALSTLIDDPENRIRIENMGNQLLEYNIYAIMMMDASFSIIVTGIFLRPIAATLSTAGAVKFKSVGYQDLEKTMYMTLSGSTIAVVSSTLLYLDLLMYFNGDYDSFRENAFLNPLVFAGNLDSILNNVGMLLVSGIFKYLHPIQSAKNIVGLVRPMLGASPSTVAPADGIASQQFVWNSRAYDDDDDGGDV